MMNHSLEHEREVLVLHLVSNAANSIARALPIDLYFAREIDQLRYGVQTDSQPLLSQMRLRCYYSRQINCLRGDAEDVNIAVGEPLKRSDHNEARHMAMDLAVTDQASSL